MKVVSIPSFAANIPRAIVQLLLVVLFATYVFAQDTPDSLTPEVFQQRLAQVEESGIEEAIKVRMREFLNQGLEAATRTRDWRTRIADYDARIGEATQVEDGSTLADRLRTALEAPVETYSADQLTEEDSTKLEQDLIEADSNLSALQSELANLEGEPGRRATRRTEIPNEIASAQTRLQEITTQESSAPPSDEPPDVSKARLDSLTVRRLAREAEITALQRELQSYDARRDLLILRTDTARRNMNATQQRVSILRDVITQRRQRAAQEAAQLARETDLETEYPRVREALETIAAESAQYSEMLTGPSGLLEKTQIAITAEQELNQQTNAFKSQLESLQTRVSLAGSSTISGDLLRQTAATLPDSRVIRRSIRARQQEIGSVQANWFELEEQMLLMDSADDFASEVLAGSGVIADSDEWNELHVRLARALNLNRESLDRASDETDKYLTSLVNQNVAESNLLNEIERINRYVEENVLWLKSGTWPSLSSLNDSGNAIRWLLDYQSWRDSLIILFRDWIAAAILFPGLIILLLRTRSNRKIEQLGEIASKRSTTVFMPTVKASLLAVSHSLPVPICFFAISIPLISSSISTEFSRSVGTGLLICGVICFFLEVSRALAKKQGVLSAHLDWDEVSVQKLRANLFVTQIIVLPLVFIVATMEAQAEADWKESLGRMAYVLTVFSTLGLSYILLRPRRGPIVNAFIRSQSPLFARYGGMVLPTLFLVSVFLVLGALAGYYYTALHLAVRLGATMAFVSFLMFLSGLVNRWLKLARRRLAREQARVKRESQKALEKDGAEATISVDEQLVDIGKVDLQTQRLLRGFWISVSLIGLWFVWADEIPALQILDRIHISDQYVTVEEIVIDPETNEQRREPRIELQALTLGDVALGILAVLITIVVARNLPGFLEIALLQRTGLGVGEKYAIATALRYALIGGGGVLAFRSVGIGWENVQWLIAALGLGLGFGLQEIFANFVSGIILLFERPIRLGDTVTIGGVNGTVSKMRIRATTITDFDKKELVVPNKEFITGQLVNWTLSDNTLRVTVPVGVAYGSDTNLVFDTLHNVAANCSLVLDDPAPKVYFLEFGDSSLNFELRAYCAGIESYLSLTHELHMEIDEAFAEKDIEIAFPQRDIHVRTVPSETKVPSEKVD